MHNTEIFDLDSVEFLKNDWFVRLRTRILATVEVDFPEKDCRFISGSFRYTNSTSVTWDKNHDINVVFDQDQMEVGLLDTLRVTFKDKSNEEYKNDFSLYFRIKGQIYNFITLTHNKFKAWKLATEVVTELCNKNDFYLKSRPARVDIFIAIEYAMEEF